MHRLKGKVFSLFYVYKMGEIIKETWEKNRVEAIIFRGKKVVE